MMVMTMVIMIAMLSGIPCPTAPPAMATRHGCGACARTRTLLASPIALHYSQSAYS